MIKIRPFLKWAGNKYHCIETILASLPSASRLIEPFTGSGAIFMNTNYPAYLLAEGNDDLVSLFSKLQAEGPNFIEYCARFFNQENNCAGKYYHHRQQFNRSKNKRYKAALFLYLNRHGYNGLCRYNQKGIYNVPFGRYIKPYFPRQEMDFFYQKSQRAQIITSDFRQTFTKARQGDVIYCDPPYVPLTVSARFTSYMQRNFTEQDQIDLAELAAASVAQGITVIISNHDTAFTRFHYRFAKIISFPVVRKISCQSNKRFPVQELIAIFRP